MFSVTFNRDKKLVAEGNTPEVHYRIVDGEVELWDPKPQRHEMREQCHHRGEKIERVNCPTCQGNVRVTVFTCPLHERCTISKPIADAQTCRGCPDYTSPQAPTP